MSAVYCTFCYIVHIKEVHDNNKTVVFILKEREREREYFSPSNQIINRILHTIENNSNLPTIVNLRSIVVYYPDDPWFSKKNNKISENLLQPRYMIKFYDFWNFFGFFLAASFSAFVRYRNKLRCYPMIILPNKRKFT